MSEPMSAAIDSRQICSPVAGAQRRGPHLLDVDRRNAHDTRSLADRRVLRGRRLAAHLHPGCVIVSLNADDARRGERLPHPPLLGRLGRARRVETIVPNWSAGDEFRQNS